VKKLLSGYLDRVTLTAYADNAPPKARAGQDQHVHLGTAVPLDGRSSHDPEGAPLSFAWAFVTLPRRSALTDTDIVFPHSPMPQFVPDVRVTYVLTLRVSDGVLTDAAVAAAVYEPGVRPWIRVGRLGVRRARGHLASNRPLATRGLPQPVLRQQ
jgi:hypothetical protein